MTSIPGWSELHPIVVHFPIALLLVAPILLVIGLAFERQRAFARAALFVLALGTAGAWVAVGSGEQASEAAEKLPGLEAAVERHGEMAERASVLFTVVTVALGALVAAPRVLKRELPRAVRRAGYAALFAAYAVSAGYLVSTAHQGGRLVHELGMHALQAGGPSAAGALTLPERAADDD